jgi:hypothetical protein
MKIVKILPNDDNVIARESGRLNEGNFTVDSQGTVDTIEVDDQVNPPSSFVETDVYVIIASKNM